MNTHNWVGRKPQFFPSHYKKKPHIEASKINMSTPKDIPYLALGEKQRKIIPWLIRRQIEEDSTRNKWSETDAADGVGEKRR